MAPTRPTAFRTLISRESYEDDDYTGVGDGLHIQQAGRTATPLAAHLQASAQSLHQASRRHRRQGSRFSSVPDLRELNIPAIDIAAANVALARRAGSYAPLVSSPLHPDTPSAYSRSDLVAFEVTEQKRLSNTSDTFGSVEGSSSVQAPMTDDKLLKPPKTQVARKRSSTAPSKLSQPRSVRDLGSDYTRYFSPFATPRPSQDDLQSQPPTSGSGQGRHGATASHRLDKRASNSFDDAKRAAARTSGESQFMQNPLQDTGNEEAAGANVLPQLARADSPYLIRTADLEKAAWFQFIDDRLGAPQTTFPYLSDPKEDDDDLHMPQWDDDVKLKPKFKEHFTRENIVSTFGLLLMILGLVTLFIVLPVVSYTGLSIIDYMYETPFDQILRPWLEHDWSWVNNAVHPLMKNVRHGLIDPDTPATAMTKQSVTGETLKLVYSDEFNKSNRTFYPGDDPYWYGFDGWYGATNDLEWYDPDAINTGNGTLSLQLDQFTTHGLAFRSGMLNSWNSLCIKGGVFEVSMSLPGPAGAHGLWPGAWTMGNLGRPGYLATTDGMWPYTYNECDSGITPNQSMPDGTSYLPGQRLAACTCSGEDHPTPGRGRGAPEIDIAEVSADWGGLGIGVATQSYQVAPFDIWWRPEYQYMETPNYNLSFVNSYTGGPFQQAVSTTTTLNNTWYDGMEYQKFAFEYQPGSDENAFIAWTIGDEEMMRFDARAIGPNGNVGQRLISEEPMSIILNLGISQNWVSIDFPSLRFPAVLQFDYVRWYQREGEEMVTCDPPGYETTEYILQHSEAYRNPNVTLWDEAGYAWPRNSLVHGCDAAIATSM